MTQQEKDEVFMRAALAESEKGRAIAPPNPSVGCVIVRDGEIIARGHTQRAGGHHAEIEAMQDAERRGVDIRGAEAYVTLEPCSHYGRTPPCALALIRHGIGRVVAAMKDPNPQVAGKGLSMLEEAGVRTCCGVLEKEAYESNRGFFTRMVTGLPWVTLKAGATLDGRTALPNGVSQWITGEAARAEVHRLRSEAGAVLTGVGTVIADDCQLTARIPGEMLPRQPLRVVLDTHLRTPENARVIGEDGRCLIICGPGAPAEKRRALEMRGAEVLEMPCRDGHTDIRAVIAELGRREVNQVLCEAGAGVNGAVLRADAADELLVFMAPMTVGAGRGMWELGPYEKLSQAGRWTYHDVSLFGNDLCIQLRKN